MVRFLHVSDVHLGFEQYGTYERFKDFGRALNHAFDMAIEQKVDLIIIGGDLFNKKNIKASTLLQADTILTKARNAGIPVYACEGNHDSLSYGTNWSWLNYLARKDLLVLLGLPSKEKDLNKDEAGIGGGAENESSLLPSWNPDIKEGSYIERTFNGELIRIYGFGYLGATTRKRIEEMADHIIRDDATNIGILHAGVEGVIANMHGTIPEHALAPLRDRLDYLALGHIHKRFSVEDWVFNPGSLENCSLEEASPKNPHGLYVVDLRRKSPVGGRDEDSEENVEAGVSDHASATFVDGSTWRRPFSVIFVDITGVDSLETVMERTVGKVSESLGILVMKPGNKTDEHRIEQKIQPSPIAGEKAAVRNGGFGTLDAYVREKSGEERSISPVEVEKERAGSAEEVKERAGSAEEVKERAGSAEEVKERAGSAEEVKERAGSAEEVKERAGSAEEVKDGVLEGDAAPDENEGAPGGNGGMPSIVIVRLRGDIRLKEKIDTSMIKDRIEGMIKPAPLHLEVRDETGSEGFTIDEETPSSREDFERQVIMELLAQGEFRDQAGDINTLMADFMRAVVSHQKEDLNTFDIRVRELAEKMIAE